jgi:hypothetical protein
MNTLANIHIESLNNTIDNTLYQHLAYTTGTNIVNKLDYLLWEYGAYGAYEQVVEGGVRDAHISDILEDYLYHEDKYRYVQHHI